MSFGVCGVEADTLGASSGVAGSWSDVPAPHLEARHATSAVDGADGAPTFSSFADMVARPLAHWPRQRRF